MQLLCCGFNGHRRGTCGLCLLLGDDADGLDILRCERFVDYLAGKVETIPELEEKLLDYYGGVDEFDKSQPCLNWWVNNVSANIV